MGNGDRPRVTITRTNDDGAETGDGGSGDADFSLPMGSIDVGDIGGETGSLGLFDITPQEPRSGGVRLAGDVPPLQRIHPDLTYQSDPKAARSLDYWSRQPTSEIVDSLRPGRDEALKVTPDGRIMNGNTRTKVLQDRGYNIDSLPRQLHSLDGDGGGRPRGGGGGSPGGGRGFGGGLLRYLSPWL